MHPADPHPALITEGLELEVGGMARAELVRALQDAGVALNAYAETLLADPVFDRQQRQRLRLVERSVADLGLPDGGTLAQVFAAAQRSGLGLCPPVTGPYLRLATLHQGDAPDSVMSRGRAPTGSVAIASAPLRDDDAYPKGFYLRVVDGQAWLRGYRSDDEHVRSPEDRLAFCAAAPSVS